MNRTTLATLATMLLVACAPGEPPSEEAAPIAAKQAKLQKKHLGAPDGLHSIRPTGDGDNNGDNGDNNNSGDNGDNNGDNGDNNNNGDNGDDSGRAGATPNAGTTGYGITYHGGPVLHGTVNAYYIWYGNWSGNSATTILTDFISNEGGSPYYNINTTYGDNSGQSVANSIHYGGSVNDNYSLGTALNDANIQTIVANHIKDFNNGVADTNALYFVLTSADVNETTGFCTQYCGWHTAGTISGADVKYSFVGNPDRCLSSCAAQSTGPNGNAGADGMASIIAHEFEETTSDPDLNAWYDSTGAENADKCAWTFGTQYTVANGAKANMKLGARDFLIQQNWLNVSPGSCALSYNSTPDFSISATPSSQSVTTGSNASYTVTVSALNGFSGAVSLSASGLSGNESGTFNPASIAGSGTSTFTVSGTANAHGAETITITGTSGALTHSAAVSLSVSAPGSNLIANGGFESGFTGWTRSGTTSLSTVAHSGSSSAQVGSTSPTNGNSSIAQTFTVPTGKTSLTVSFWYQVHCPDTVTYDWATATLKDNMTGRTTTLLSRTCTNNGSWVQLFANPAVTAGHSMTLTLTSRDDNYPGDATYTLYDDVSVQ